MFCSRTFLVRLFLLAVCEVLFCPHGLLAQTSAAEQVQVNPPPMRRAKPPAPDATPEVLEQQGDELRGSKLFLDSLDYYNAALAKSANNYRIVNKMGIAQLQMQRWKEARKCFERSIKANRDYADAYNNLGVVYYEEKNYGKAIKQYQKAIALQDSSASFYSNMGAAYFSRKDFPKAVDAYAHALQLDPDVFERTSRIGVSAQLPSPEDRAYYDYVVAKLYAKMGVTDRSLEYLKKAMEEGYKKIDDVYKDAEFAELRKDPRFTELMKAKPPAITE